MSGGAVDYSVYAVPDIQPRQGKTRGPRHAKARIGITAGLLGGGSYSRLKKGSSGETPI